MQMHTHESLPLYILFKRGVFFLSASKVIAMMRLFLYAKLLCITNKYLVANYIFNLGNSSNKHNRYSFLTEVLKMVTFEIHVMM